LQHQKSPVGKRPITQKAKEFKKQRSNSSWGGPAPSVSVTLLTGVKGGRGCEFKRGKKRVATTTTRYGLPTEEREAVDSYNGGGNLASKPEGIQQMSLPTREVTAGGIDEALKDA